MPGWLRPRCSPASCSPVRHPLLVQSRHFRVEGAAEGVESAYSGLVLPVHDCSSSPLIWQAARLAQGSV